VLVKQTRAERVERSDVDPNGIEPSLTWSSYGNTLQRLWRNLAGRQCGKKQ